MGTWYIEAVEERGEKRVHHRALDMHGFGTPRSQKLALGLLLRFTSCQDDKQIVQAI